MEQVAGSFPKVTSNGVDHTSRDHTDGLIRWIDLIDPAPEQLTPQALGLDLHPLVLEDLQHPHQRPKLEQYENMTVIVAKPASYDDASERIQIGELFLVVGDGYLISVRHGPAAQQISGIGVDGGTRRISPVSQCQVVHDLLDQTVDHYLSIARELSVDISQIEADVFSVEFNNPSRRIYRLKRQVLDLIRNVEPLLDPLDQLTTSSTLGCLSLADQADYFRDVADHTRRLVSELRRDSSLLSDILQANLSQMSVAQNDEMRRMSAWAAIFLVPTLLAGIWGMNFAAMPELEWRYGYPAALLTMLSVSIGLWLNFRRLGWLGGRQDR